jgi:hypothetical protein
MVAADGEDGKNVGLSAGMNDADETFESEIDRERASKWLWDQVAVLAPIRAEDLRKLNEECRQEEREAKAAARRSRRLERKNGRRGSDVVQSEVKPTIVAEVCDPGVPTMAGLTEAGYNAGPIVARAETPSTESGSAPDDSRKTGTDALPEPAANCGDAGRAGRRPGPDFQVEIDRVEADKRLGDELARRAMIRAANIRKSDQQWWHEAEAACRSRGSKTT